MVEKHHFLGVEVILAAPRMREIFQQVRRLAQSDAPVLLIGESGSGKEVIARALHHYSPRRLKPFADLSCAGLPAELVESELFGHERGAYSGAHATQHALLEMAHEGTLFLDEIDSLDPRIQSKLLRVLDTSLFHRLGAVRQTRANVRIIAGSTSLLPPQALLARLNAQPLVIPPLRERPEDIEALAVHFLSQQNPELRLASDAMMALYSYHWPGNVRELRNTVLRSALLAKGPILHADDIVFSSRIHAGATGIAGLEPALIRRALADSGGHRQRAAISLGISRHALARKIRAYGLSPALAPARRSV